MKKFLTFFFAFIFVFSIVDVVFAQVPAGSSASWSTRVGDAPPLAEGGIWPTPRGYVLYDSFVQTHLILKAIDILGVNTTDDVLAAHNGKVVFANFETAGINGGYGNVVLIEDTQNNMISLYAHLSKYFVSVGDSIQKGQAIGKVGATSSNPSFQNLHLHYEHRAKGLIYGLVGQGPELAPPILPKIIPDRCSTRQQCDTMW